MSNVRQKKLVALIKKFRKSAVVLTSPASLFYYFNLHTVPEVGDYLALITPSISYLFHSPLINKQDLIALNPDSTIQPFSSSQEFTSQLVKIIPKNTKIGVESTQSFRITTLLQTVFSPTTLEDFSNNINKPKLIKSNSEILAITKACQITAKVMNWAKTVKSLRVNIYFKKVL